MKIGLTTKMINRMGFLCFSFPQKIDRPLHNSTVNQIHGSSSGNVHGVYSSGNQSSMSTSYITGQSYMQNQNYGHGPYPPSTVQVYSHTGLTQPQSYGTMVQGYGGQPQSGFTQGHMKKGSVRNGDVHKRCRLQSA